MKSFGSLEATHGSAHLHTLHEAADRTYRVCVCRAVFPPGCSDPAASQIAHLPQYCSVPTALHQAIILHSVWATETPRLKNAPKYSHLVAHTASTDWPCLAATAAVNADAASSLPSTVSSNLHSRSRSRSPWNAQVPRTTDPTWRHASVFGPTCTGHSVPSQLPNQDSTTHQSVVRTSTWFHFWPARWTVTKSQMTGRTKPPQL
ncbi:hypothetical protein B0T17DRAFT_10384 [Bombardia bombarda]|uniref:Uncharacterized protein n=1 Tax=Bombardia bombarda TaxID=252184 RepID=A0AA39XIF4_9PEZI|nr:hypothetical protein B0T17DRAFT_10384 [Bombardia bombarda]